MRVALAAALALSLGCAGGSGNDQPEHDGDGGVREAGVLKGDAAWSTGEHDARPDASAAADAADRADAGVTDGGDAAPRSPATRETDAAADATSPRETPSSAGGTLRFAVCGDQVNYPSPLATDTAARSAALVGNMRFGFLEGPVWVAEHGVLLFSDMNFAAEAPKGPPSRIRRLTPPAAFDVFVDSANSNGLALVFGGGLLAATHDSQSLSVFDLISGARSDLDIRYQGKHFNSPNDLTVRDDGTVYFTDPDYQLGERTSELGSTGAYRVSPPLTGAARSAELVDGTLQQPNGVALSPDQRTLYLGSSGNEIWKFDVAPDGSLDARTKFAEVGGSDGMTVDCAGNLYVASGTIEVFAPDGRKLGDISTAETPSNVAFGGVDRKTLYITAQTGLYSIALAVPGFPY